MLCKVYRHKSNLFRALRLPLQSVAHAQPHRRRLHLAPPFLLDNYTPRYQLLSSSRSALKRSQSYAHLRNCNLCPRLCGVNRYEKIGVCLIGGSTVKIGTIAPHFGEEPCIQGHNGSGSVFFSGCNLRCVFCQNHDIAHTTAGFDLTPTELADWMIKLQDVGGCHNINFVTPEHVVPQVVLAVLEARDMGLKLPIVYNTSSFDSVESIELLDGIVDIYLPDFKVWNAETSKRLLKADDYASEARRTIKMMHDQVGDLCFTPDGLAKKGVLVRHLVMPGGEEEGKKIVDWLAKEVSNDLVVHVMEQYHPRAHVGKAKRRTGTLRKNEIKSIQDEMVEPGGTKPTDQAAKEVRYAEINRPVDHEEVSVVRKAAEDAGLWRFIDVAQHGGYNI